MLLAGVLIVAGLRLAWVFYERRQPGRLGQPPTAAAKLNPDYNVYVPHSYVTDLKSAQAMKGATLWVRDGWRYVSQAYDPVQRRIVPKKGEAALGPLQKLTVEDVITEPSKIAGMTEVDFVFEDPAATPAWRVVAVGACENGNKDCRFYVDAMFLTKDPRQLYSHWKPEVWKAIENHEVHEGMSELQVDFSLGPGRPVSGYSERTVEFRPPGRPRVRVVFDKRGYASDIEVVPPTG